MGLCSGCSSRDQEENIEEMKKRKEKRKRDLWMEGKWNLWMERELDSGLKEKIKFAKEGRLNMSKGREDVV